MTTGRSGVRRWIYGAIAIVLVGAVGATIYISRRPTYVSPASVDSLDLGKEPAPLVRPTVEANLEEPATPAEAVSSFLEAERDGRIEVSYALLDRRTRRNYPVFESWSADRADRPRVISFEVAEDSAASPRTQAVEVTVTVTQEPALDPFVGFVPAQATQRWLARQESGRWRVEDRPAAVFPEVPAETGALEVARRWAGHMGRCEEGEASSLQAAEELYGLAELSRELCRQRSSASVGSLEAFDPAEQSNEGLAAFGPDIDLWARTVEVEARRPFRLVLAPLGDQWKVLAALPAKEVSR
jgi:hypothetical protein